jgi:hypothetical protein
MNTSQLDKLNEVSFEIRRLVLAYLKTPEAERSDSVFIQEVRRIGNSILNIADEMELRK